jgi:hypothetical protein
MLNVIGNSCDCKYINSYWLNNVVINQDRNKEKINNKYEIKIDADYNKNMINKDYDKPIRKLYLNEPVKNFQKQNSYRKQDNFASQYKQSRLTELVSKNRGADIIIKSWTKLDL